MYRKQGIRWTLILLLALLLAAPALAGERTYQESAGWPGGGLWQRLVQWFQVEVLGATQCEAGSSIDPDGRCVVATGTADATQCEAGSSIDPNGGCVGG